MALMGRVAIASLSACLIAANARADVVDAAANGFSIKISTDVNAAPTSVYRALLTIGSWWDPEHTYSGKGASLSLDARPGGCFCEQLPGGGVQHMTVTFVDAPRSLHLSGGLGPLGAMAVNGSMVWTITDGAMGKSRIELTYNVGGYVPGGLNTLAPVVDGVLAAQVRRFKAFVETGRPQ